MPSTKEVSDITRVPTFDSFEADEFFFSIDSSYRRDTRCHNTAAVLGGGADPATIVGNRDMEEGGRVQSSSVSSKDRKHPSSPSAQPLKEGQVAAGMHQRMTTRDIQREQEKVSRTTEVKERLGPVVARLKASLARMESLEESMDRLRLHENTVDGKELSLPASENSEQLLRSTLLRSGKTREVMHGSMELVKKKLLRLKRMEETLALSEDRRNDLQHQLLQVSLSKPNLEMAATKRQNVKLQELIDQFQAKGESRERERSMDDEAQEKLAALQQELVEAYGERDKLKEDLLQRQSKINEQAIQCDELECQVEHMTIVYNEMISSLKQLKDRNACLEQELMETRNIVRRDRFHPRTIHFQNSKESSATELTVSTAAETTFRGDDHSFDSSYTSSSASVTALPTSDNGSHDDASGFYRTKPSFMISMDDDHKSMIETLMSTIEVMDRENAELREEKHHFIGKWKTQQQEMERQADVIRGLELRLEKLGEISGLKCIQVESQKVGAASEKEDKQGREEENKGSFFQRLLPNSNAGREILASNNPKRHHLRLNEMG